MLQPAAPCLPCACPQVFSAQAPPRLRGSTPSAAINDGLSSLGALSREWRLPIRAGHAVTLAPMRFRAVAEWDHNRRKPTSATAEYAAVAAEGNEMFHSCVNLIPRILLCASIGAMPILVSAADFAVTTAADEFDGICDVHCSLRDAVSAANGTPGANRIMLHAQNYELSRPASLDPQGVPIDEDDNLTGDLDIAGELTIQGVSAGLPSRINGQTNDRLFEVLSGAKLTLNRLALAGGNTAFNGGAIENHGAAKLRGILLEDNQAVTPPQYAAVAEADNLRFGQGGAIANYASLEIRYSMIQDNRAQGSSGNNQGRGGAIFNQGTLKLSTSTLRRNRVADQSLKGAGGGLYNLGVAYITRSAFLENYGLRYTVGGAIANEGGLLRMANSTLSGHIRGGLSNGYPGNPQGALPKADLISVTIAGNAGGIRNWGDLRLRNSLIAGNFEWETGAPFNCENIGDTFRYQAIGLLLNNEPSNCTGDVYVPYEQTFTHVMKILLFDGDNGGPTKTYPLLPGSPALDAAIGDCYGYDQRGFPRPLDGTGDGVANCDLGAFELGTP
jgi:CSLREA domain-containing protein